MPHLAFILMACTEPQESKDNGGGGTQDNNDSEGGGEVGSLNEAELTLAALYPNGGEMAGVPYGLAIDGIEFSFGLTGEPHLVGSGTFVAEIGPHIVSSHPDDQYYPDEVDGYTDDGLPMVIKDDRRYVSQAFEVNVDEPNERVEYTMTAMLGEAYYTCSVDVNAYDEDAWENLGESIDDYELEMQWIDWVGNGMIEPADPAAFGHALQPGEALVIDDDGYSLALETTTDNLIKPYWPEGWREGTGLNDFAFRYHNPTDLTYQEEEGIVGSVTTVRCLYDWWPYPSDDEEDGEE